MDLQRVGRVANQNNQLDMYKVNNLSGTYANYKYVVIRDCTKTNEGFWYYGAYNNLVLAQQVAREIGNGLVVEPQDIEQ